MSIYKNLYSTSSLLTHPTRMAVLIALSDGNSLPAGELAQIAHVSPQTMSEHLTKLVKAEMLIKHKSGKHRYYRIANSRVVEVVEAIANLTPAIETSSLKDSIDKQALSLARTCYGHVAGKLGIQLTEALITLEYIQDLGNSGKLTNKGFQWCQNFGLVLSKKSVQESIPYHVDWTERKFHIAGPFALKLTKRLFELGWIKNGTTRRSIVVTQIGKEKLEQEFNISL
ncbi:ArsR/SmtB family transcription factor [Listeria kieliensis]|uniref:ArsR/SmtB family transcription factor n=1 Tax=Listeria kieliensis TaxID=1621700 RepID=UPI000E2136B3|nr:metalloregulator ArsR/SmtB family transcription factor [Listeria kieliensis]